MTFAVVLFVLSLVSLVAFVVYAYKGVKQFVSGRVPGVKIVQWIFAEAGLLLLTVLLFAASVISGAFAAIGWILSYFI